jgi:hypothetical protein
MAGEIAESLEEWREIHWDYDHDGLVNRAGIAVRSGVISNVKDLQADLARYQDEIDKCWVCHPELQRNM